MRLLCLYFPRLATSLARRSASGAYDSPLVFVQGSGDTSLVADVSVEATMAGVTVGMPLAAARQRCPAARFLPDNASEALATLEGVATILRARATPFVEIVSREQIVVSLAGLESRFVDEATAAERIAALAREWGNLDVRAGVADTIEEACSAARRARRCATIAPETGNPGEPISAYDPSRHLSMTATFGRATSARDARAALVKQLGRLEALLEGRSESARRVRLVLDRDGQCSTLLFEPAAPVHSAAEVVQLVAVQTSDESFTGVTGISVSLEALGPRVRVERTQATRTAATAAPIAGAQSRQRPLLRAG